MILPLAGCGSEPASGPRGWYFAGSKIEDKQAPGGFGPCDNFPKECDEKTPGAPGELSLIASPDEIVEFRGRKCILLRLVNRTQKTLAFLACDSSLFVVQESLGIAGWTPIESFPSSDCGNSDHRVFLEPDEYWEFYAIRRPGRLRFRLEPHWDQELNVKAGSLFSNEYDGSVD